MNGGAVSATSGDISGKGNNDVVLGDMVTDFCIQRTECQTKKKNRVPP